MELIIVGRLEISETVFRGLWELSVIFVLGLIGFQIGLDLTKSLFKESGRSVVAITLTAAFLSLAAVFFGVFLVTNNFSLALLLGSVAVATAPAGTIAVIKKYDTEGPLTKALKTIVGLDDVIAIITFMVALAFVRNDLSSSFSMIDMLVLPGREILGGFGLGLLIGMIYFVIAKIIAERKLRLRKTILILALSSITLGSGLSEYFGFSHILTCMAIGMILINLVPQEGRITKRTIETIMPPFYIIFFTFTGMHLEIGSLWSFSLIGLIVLFIVLRSAGKIAGALFSEKLVTGPPELQYTGFGLLSQAGVALGLAALSLPMLRGVPGGIEIATKVLTVIVVTDVFFEIVGPIGVEYALTEAGEAYRY